MDLPTLRPYQQAGVNFLTSRRCSMLGDEPGLGKTAQAIIAALKSNAEGLAVVTTASGVPVWKREIDKWGKSLAYNWIVSYDQLVRDHKDKPKWGWITPPDKRVLVIDEAHRLKNPDTEAFKVIYAPGGLAHENWKRIILASGTFAPNHYGELWTHLQLLGVTTDDYGTFLRKFCVVEETAYGPKVLKNQNAGELKELLSGVYIGRRKKNVLKDLPPLDFVQTPLVLGNTNDTAINDLAAQVFGQGGMDDEALASYLVANETALSTVRKEAGLAKVPAILQWVKDQDLPKLVLFAWHFNVIEKLQIGLSMAGFEPTLLTGHTSPSNRAARVDRFQTDPKCRVFIGQIKAAGEAITLTAAKTVAIAEASWSPGDNYQAACRAHRFGQTDPVLCHFLGVQGTIDDAIMRVQTRKARELAKVLG